MEGNSTKSKMDWIAAVGFLTLFGPFAATAQTETLIYTGSAFTTVSITGNPTFGAANSVPENTGQLVLSSPLGPSVNDVTVIPISFSFDDTTQLGSIYLNSNGPTQKDPGNSSSFMFSTDANGVITEWNISITGGIFGGTNSPSSAALTITNAGDTFSSGFSTPSCANPAVTFACYDVRESNSSSGVFSFPLQAPEIDPSSAATGLTMLLAGVAVLQGRRTLRR